VRRRAATRSGCIHAGRHGGRAGHTTDGAGDTGDTPILFIPGLGCPAAVWDGTVAHVRGELHVITAAGFAGQPPIDKPLNATIRAELADYIRTHRLDHPVIIGHSMGGFLALWLAATEPDLVGPVISVDSAPTLGAGDASWEAYARKRRDAWKAMSADKFAAAVRAQFTPMFRDPKRHAAIIADVARSDPRAFSDAYYELFTADIRAELPKITTPVLAVLADGSSQRMIRDQLAKIPGHEIVVIANTRHFVMLDEPDAFYRIIDKFLAAHPAR
jgi:N-formylmaleamate deformylase